MPASIQRQIFLLRIYAAFTFPFACIPFLYFWFAAHGISLEDYLWLVAIYYASMIAAEIPTGFLADRYGRIPAAVLGPSLLASSFVIFGLSSSWTAFAIGQCAMGLGHSFLSGPPAALLFETLRRAGRSEDYLRLESSMHAIRLGGTGVAFLLGGIVAQAFGYQACVLFTAPLCLVASITAMFLRGTGRRRTTRRRPPIVVSASRDLRLPAVAWLTAYFVVLFCLLRYPFHLYQPFLQAAGQDVPWRVGLLFFALNAVAAPCSRLTPWLQSRIGERALFWILPMTLAASMWAMSEQVNRLGIALFFLHQIPFGMHWSLIQNFANHRIRSASRTTVLSALSFFGRLTFVGFLTLTNTSLRSDDAGATVTDILRYVGIGGILATTVCLLLGRRFLAGRD
ncbi:MAG: MFS transporter [Planctomycetes bacterium]|nr:MFS transporter [Planctomycetota bacterium]